MIARASILPSAPTLVESAYAGLDQGRLAMRDTMADIPADDERDTLPDSERVTDEPGGDL